MRTYRVLLLSLVAAIMPASALPVAFVREKAPGDGSSWTNATGDLQYAIDSIRDAGGGFVYVAEGTYRPDAFPNGGSTARAVHFSLRNGVTVLGGFPPGGNPGLTERDPQRYPTVCSAEIGNVGAGDNAYHVFFHPAGSALTRSAVLSGFTITGANADAAGPSGNGAGMYNVVSSPVVTDCVFLDNHSAGYGGAVYNSSGDSVFSHCVFSDNTARWGGAVSVNVSNPLLINCVFTGNRADEGGGVYCLDGSSPEIRSGTFLGNVASLGGGGVFCQTDCKPWIANSILWMNTGDAVLDKSSDSILVNCQIEGGWTGSGSGNSSADPEFLDASNPAGADAVWGTLDDGLTLSKGSPARDTGLTAELPADAGDVDLDGNTLETIPWDLRRLSRTAVGTPDRGAYEFQRPVVTFSIGTHGTRTGGGALVQTVDEGGSAVAPVITPEFGWNFTGWSRSFTNVYIDIAVTAQYSAVFAPGAICYVTERGSGGRTGVSWEHAADNLQQAINAVAYNGGQVWVAEGTYLPDSWPNGGSGARAVHFALRNGVKVFGGFPATGNPGFAQRDPARHPVVCSGGIGGASRTDDALHVFYLAGTPALNATAVLNGVTITGGNATGTDGGGMYCDRSSPSVVQCVFVANSADGEGGAVFNGRCNPLFSHCVFYRNSSHTGGAVCNRRSAPLLHNCLFTGNEAAAGGAVFNGDESSPQIKSCTFSDNAAEEKQGGAVFNEAAACDPRIANTILWENRGSEVIDNDGAASQLTNCIIYGGWSGLGGLNHDVDPRYWDAGSPAGADGFWGTGDDGLRITKGSPARDVGEQGSLPDDTGDVDHDGNTIEPIPLDLRGQPRLVPSTLDRGAYEFQRPVVTFDLAGRGTRTGGGALVQTLEEGGNAAAPTVAGGFGWVFSGWDKAFTNVTEPLTVQAVYTPFFAPGATCYVKQGGTGNGTSWAAAAGDVQQAIEAIAPGGGQVWIAAGVYFPNSWPNGGSAPREVHFSLRNGVRVIGGFPATGNPGLADRNPAVFSTVLSGNTGSLTDATDNVFHVFYHPATAALSRTAFLDGVVIRDGYADGAGVSGVGAGMYNRSSSPMLARCYFLSNYAANYGAGIYMARCNSEIFSCFFTDNNADEGGALWMEDSSPTLANCLLARNFGTGSEIAAGQRGAPLISNCTLFSSMHSFPVTSQGTVLTINLSIIASAGSSVTMPAGMSITSSLVRGGYPGFENFDANPQFSGPGSVAGGDNIFGTADDGFQLTAASPAINAGSAAQRVQDAADIDGDGNRSEALPLDITGISRITDGQPECGAYEFTPGTMTIAYWRTLQFSAAQLVNPALEATVWGNAADPDSDGIPNCGEYRFASNPTVPDSPLRGLYMVNIGGVNYLTFTYVTIDARTAVTVTPQESPMLSAGWTTAPTIPAQLTPGVTSYMVRVPVVGPSRFVRLRFECTAP